MGQRRRIAGALRAAPSLAGRAGWRGGIELLLARALERFASYERTVLIAVDTGGPVPAGPPPRRLRAPEPFVLDAYAEVAARAEPDAVVLGEETIRRRFARGDELWVMEDGGGVGHMRWLSRSTLLLGDREVALLPHERALEHGVTLGPRRARLSRSTTDHGIHAIGGEGVDTLVAVINGFNRGYLRSAGAAGFRRLAIVHRVTLGGRTRRRFAPCSPEGAAWLESHGLAEGWDAAARRVLARPYLDPEMAAHKRAEHLALADRWLPALDGRRLLKTDLWEEGVGGDELLYELERRGAIAHGVDVSRAVVEAARRNGADLRVADLRNLPYEDASFDVIVSTSTIDHFADLGDLRASLRELGRVLAPGGHALVTCDNPQNVGDPLLRLAARAGAVPFPVGVTLSREELREELRAAGLQPGDDAFLVHGPRMLTTLLVRGARLLAGARGARAAIAALERLGRLAPRRMAAFVAVLAER